VNGVHDMGGMHCYGPVDCEADDVLFHQEWESQVLAIALAMGATGTWNLDQSRSARESLPAPFYLRASYYQIWLAGLENLLIEHQLITREELRAGVSQSAPKKLKRILKSESVASALAAGSPVSRTPSKSARFSVGTKVTVRNLHSPTHTRLPGYIRQRTGEIVLVHGCHVYPDSHAQGLGENPEWLYNVRFDSHKLWGSSAHAGAVHVDCWEPYLDPSVA